MYLNYDSLIFWQNFTRYLGFMAIGTLRNETERNGTS